MKISFLAVLTLAFFAWPALAAAEDLRAFSHKQLQDELAHGQVYRRILALEALGYRHTPEAVGLIIETMLHDRSQPVRRTAQRLLQDVADPRVETAVVAGLADPDRDVRLAAIDVAGLVRDPAMAGYLLDAAQAHPRDKDLVLQALNALRELVYRLEPEKGFEARLVPWLENKNRKLRLTAVIVLAILSRPASLPPLLELWDRADAQLRLNLSDAFANIGHVDPVPKLLAALPRADRNLQLHLLYALAQIQSYSALPEIRRLLADSRDPRTRMACLYALTEIPDPENVPAILAMLDDQDPTVLHWATYALSQLEAKTAGPAVMTKLSHPKPLVRASAATALGELGYKPAEEKLAALVADDQEAQEVRIAAGQALVRLGNPAGVPVLLHALEDRRLDLNVRLSYAMALGALGDEKIREAQAPKLHSSVYSEALTAALVLAVKGDDRGRTVLFQALEHGYPAIRRYAILGLERIADDASLKALADAANDDPDAVVRILCSASLVKAGYPDFRVLIWNALETKDEDTRSEAIIALGQSADSRTINDLRWYLKREPSIPVRQTIQRVLREWKNQQQ
ncbi:MAG: HEAT repeat domain-containing protein [candidate division FCPU426 bacterium]